MISCSQHIHIRTCIIITFCSSSLIIRRSSFSCCLLLKPVKRYHHIVKCYQLCLQARFTDDTELSACRPKRRHDGSSDTMSAASMKCTYAACLDAVESSYLSNPRPTSLFHRQLEINHGRLVCISCFRVTDKEQATIHSSEFRLSHYHTYLIQPTAKVITAKIIIHPFITSFHSTFSICDTTDNNRLHL